MTLPITATYKYDIFGRRLQKNVNGNVINFFWENDTMTYELNESFQPIRKYITGLGIPKGDSITSCLAEPRQSDAMDNYEGHLEYSEVTDWYHIFLPTYAQPWYTYMKDQVGTIYKVHSLKTRSIVESRTYDTFGNLVNQTGTTQTPLGFQGKYYDAESGLNYFYHRYYNPMIGRFTTEDPIGLNDGLNMYKFNYNNPINFIDPKGLSCILGEKLTAILSVGFINSIIASSQSDVAFEESQKQGFPKSSIHNGVMDAFRHCFWSCIMAQELGKEAALKIGIIHEECSDNQPLCEKNMDLKNNATGVKISEKGKTGRKSCRDGCNNAISRGDLIILEK